MKGYSSYSRRQFVKVLAAAGAGSAIQGTFLTGCKSFEPKQKFYDLLVYGATPGGIACAVRAAREGLKVLLVSFNDRIGGMLTSGLGVWDTLYEGYRSPIYNELRQSLFDYYKSVYGENSDTYHRALPGKTGHNNGTFEAHVAEKLVNELVIKENNISALLNHYPVSVNKNGQSIGSIALQQMNAEHLVNVNADYFADCSYEGDLMAVAGVKYRVGREAKSDFYEKHAGKIYMDPQGLSVWDERQEGVFTGLNIRNFGHHQNIIYPESTHEADDRVQAYNMRYYVTNDPDNQIKLTPSEQYDPAYLKTLEFQGTPEGVIKPNGKFGLNRPQLVGLHNQYVEGNWETRKKVIDEHIRVNRDMLYWVQNHPDAPESWKKAWEGWGFAADEYVDNHNNPYEIYVREARRLVGKHVYTENDLALHSDYDRTPLFHDSIGIIEWYQDCHACTFEKVPGSLHEGKMMLHKETFPGQLPYRSILPMELDNFLVPVCLSATHVAWGAVRLEPTWMQIGESAAYAILQSKKEGVDLPHIDTETLTRTLAEKRSMVTFFNDFYVDGKASWIPALQYFGTKGFFPSYDARPDESLDTGTARLWIEGVVKMKENKLEAGQLGKALNSAQPEGELSLADFNDLLKRKGLSEMDYRGKELSRGAACEYLYKLIE